MSVNPPQVVAVNCPACRTQYTAPVTNAVDVGRDPRLKALLLQGRLNVGICPKCGAAGMLSLPLVYHDPAKELLLCLVPQELRMNEAQRQRVIGEMSNAVINSLPAEQRRGYMLRPRIFLTRQSMVEAVLEADGISKQMLQAQQEKARLIADMVQAVDDPLRLSGLIGQAGATIDAEFFTLLALHTRIAEQDRQTDTVTRLNRLREELVERTPAGREDAARQEALDKALAGLDQKLTREDLLERLTAAHGAKQEQAIGVLVALGRQLIDYRFFQLLTARIDLAEKESRLEAAASLKDLRQHILDISQELDAQVRDRMQERAQLLVEIARSPDPKEAVQAHFDKIDSLFLSVLEASIQQNELQHRHEAAEALRSIQNTILELFRENAPPEAQFIDRLLQADYPDGTRKMLMDNKSIVNADLIGLMEELAQDLAAQGDAQASEQLRGIRAQAELLLA